MSKKIEHHSVTDWDFSGGTVKILDNGQYVGAPSSLRLQGVAAPAVNRAILCREATTQVLPSGEVRSWTRSTSKNWGPYLVFRNQQALGGSNLKDCYFWHLWGTIAYFRVFINNVMVPIGSVPITMNENTWQHWRTVFWDGLQPGVGAAIVVEFYEEVAGTWIKRGATQYDPNNRWVASGINRMGLGWGDRVGEFQWFDNTELWGPT